MKNSSNYVGHTSQKMFMEPFAKDVFTEANIAYTAGFFDGEGHIRISKHGSRGSYMLQVTCCQSTPEPLDLFVALYDGTVAKRRSLYKTGHKTQYTWQCSSYSAELFLRAVYPYLRCKKDEADIALDFRRTFGGIKRTHGNKPLDKTIIEVRANMKRMLENLRVNKREAYNT